MSFLDDDEDVSIGLTAVFMKIVGFWLATNRFERRVRNITLIYTLTAILFAVWVQTTDFYYSWGDFGACLYTSCNILSLTMPFFKILVLLTHKKDFFRLILYMQEKFLHGVYDDYERKVLIGCKRQCTFFICFFTFFTKATVISYIVSPIIANIGRNESDRVLPFNMWVNLPLTMTPYFEIAFVLQVLSLYHIGVSYFCFDNFLCIMNLHVAGQFRILQYRMANVTDLKWKDIEENVEKSGMNSAYFAAAYYTVLRNYIRQHQALIQYCVKLEKVFSMIVLGQLLMFSVLICLDGYQILMADAPVRQRLIFIFHITGCVSQLLMFTYSCDCIIRDSRNVAQAVYNGPWTLLPITTSGRLARQDLIMVIMRSHVPCCLTARGFCIVSLETYTGVLSSAASYFTLLQQRTEEAINS